jgi:hypothetical protein
MPNEKKVHNGGASDAFLPLIFAQATAMFYDHPAFWSTAGAAGAGAAQLQRLCR